MCPIKKLFLPSLIAAICFASTNSLAMGSAAINDKNLSPFQLRPRLDVSGYVGQGIIGNAQGLIPIFGDVNHLFYGDLQGKAGNSTAGWMLGGGFGYRQVFRGQVLGGYLLASYDGSPTNNKFGVINPGIESLGENWDFFLNGYIPIKKRLFGTNLATGQPTDYYDVRLQAHNEFHTPYFLQENASVGADMEIGRKIPFIHGLKFYLGGYHFDSRGLGSINGGTARLNYQLNNYLALETRYSHGNVQKNALLFGIKVSLGGIANREQQGISGRLLDPINNNIATLDKGSAVPVKTNLQKASTVLAHDDVWFFDPAATTQNTTSGDGTYENPFKGLTPANYQAVGVGITPVVDSAPLLYFSPGTYNISGFGGNTVIDNRVLIDKGFSLYGRTNDFTHANADQSVVFNGELDIVTKPDYSDSVITLDSISVINNHDNIATISVANSDVILNNTIVTHAYSDSLNVISAINVTDSTLRFAGGNNTVTSANGVGASTGIQITSDDPLVSAAVVFEDGVNNVNVTSNNGNATRGNANAIGISATSINGGAAVVSFSDGTNNINVVSNGTGTATGIVLDAGAEENGSSDNFSPLAFTGGTNTIKVAANGGDATGIALNASSAPGIGTRSSNDVSGNNIDVLFIGGTNTINVAGNGNAYGINATSYAGGTSTIDFANVSDRTNINVAGNNVIGINAVSSGSGISTINFDSNATGPVTRAAKFFTDNVYSTKLNDSGNKIPLAITLTGTTSANGIVADSGSQITIDSAVIASQADFDSMATTYTTMTKVGAATGYKINWSGSGFTPIAW